MRRVCWRRPAKIKIKTKIRIRIKTSTTMLPASTERRDALHAKPCSKRRAPAEKRNAHNSTRNARSVRRRGQNARHRLKLKFRVNLRKPQERAQRKRHGERRSASRVKRHVRAELMLITQTPCASSNASRKLLRSQVRRASPCKLSTATSRCRAGTSRKVNSRS